MMATDAAAPAAAHARASGHAASPGVELPPEEVAGLAVRDDPGQGEPAAPGRALPYLAEKHLARAYGRERRPNGHKTCYLRATELRGGPKRAVGPGHTPRLMGTLVRPSRP